MRDARAKPRLGLGLMYRNDLCLSLVVPPWQKMHQLDTRMESHQGDRSQHGMQLPVPLTLGRRKAMEDGIPDVLQSTTSSPSSSSVVQAGAQPKHFNQWRSITSNRFVLNTVKGHHLQHRCHPLLFCNLKQFNIKTAIAHCPIIQKEVWWTISQRCHCTINWWYWLLLSHVCCS